GNHRGVIVTPPMPRTRRDRRQQARETAKLAAELASAQRCPIARVSNGVAQIQTFAAPDFTIEQVKVHAHRRTPARAEPKSFLPVDARLPDDLKRLLLPVDDDADLFTRDPRGWRLGYPRGGFDGSSGSTRPSIGEVEHC